MNYPLNLSLQRGAVSGPVRRPRPRSSAPWWPPGSTARTAPRSRRAQIAARDRPRRYVHVERPDQLIVHATTREIYGMASMRKYYMQILVVCPSDASACLGCACCSCREREGRRSPGTSSKEGSSVLCRVFVGVPCAGLGSTRARSCGAWDRASKYRRQGVVAAAEVGEQPAVEPGVAQCLLSVRDVIQCFPASFLPL